MSMVSNFPLLNTAEDVDPYGPMEWNLAWPPLAPILVALGFPGFTPAPPGELPAIPTRAQVCGIQTSLQGLTYHTQQYGDIPAWSDAKLNDGDRAGAREEHHNIGDTHIPIPISQAYKEPGTLWPAELCRGL